MEGRKIHTVSVPPWAWGFAAANVLTMSGLAGGLLGFGIAFGVMLGLLLCVRAVVRARAKRKEA